MPKDPKQAEWLKEEKMRNKKAKLKALKNKVKDGHKNMVHFSKIDPYDKKSLCKFLNK